MALGCKQYIVELEVPIDDTVLMQELQGQADLGCIESGRCINIGEVLANNLGGAFLSYTRAIALDCERLMEPELTLTLRDRTVLPEYDASNPLRDNTQLQNTTLFLYGMSRSDVQ